MALKIILPVIGDQGAERAQQQNHRVQVGEQRLGLYEREDGQELSQRVQDCHVCHREHQEPGDGEDTVGLRPDVPLEEARH